MDPSEKKPSLFVFVDSLHVVQSMSAAAAAAAAASAAAAAEISAVLAGLGHSEEPVDVGISALM